MSRDVSVSDVSRHHMSRCAAAITTSAHVTFTYHECDERREVFCRCCVCIYLRHGLWRQPNTSSLRVKSVCVRREWCVVCVCVCVCVSHLPLTNITIEHTYACVHQYTLSSSHKSSDTVPVCTRVELQLLAHKAGDEEDWREDAERERERERDCEREREREKKKERKRLPNRRREKYKHTKSDETGCTKTRPDAPSHAVRLINHTSTTLCQPLREKDEQQVALADHPSHHSRRDSLATTRILSKHRITDHTDDASGSVIDMARINRPQTTPLWPHAPTPTLCCSPVLLSRKDSTHNKRKCVCVCVCV